MIPCPLRRASSRSRSTTPKAMRVRIFCPGPCNEGGAGVDRTLARLAGARDRAGRAGRVGQDASGDDLGGCCRRARRLRRAILAKPAFLPRSPPARWSSRTRPRIEDERGAVSSHQSRARGGGLSTLHRADRAVGVAGDHCRRGIAATGAAGRDAAGARRRDAARRHRQTRRRPPACPRRKRRRLSLDPYRALVRRGARRSHRARQGGAAAGPAAEPRRWLRKCSAIPCSPA